MNGLLVLLLVALATACFDSAEVQSNVATCAVQSCTGGTDSDLDGESFLYDASLTIPEGTISNLTISERLDAGLVFVQDENYANPGNVQCDPDGDLTFTPCVLGTPAITTDGSGRQVITWTLGNVSNPPDADSEVIGFQVRAAVANVAQARAGAQPRALLTADSQQVSSSPITVVEPQLQATSVLSGSSPDGGDTVTVQTTITHPGGSSADAHDLQLSYDLSGTQLIGQPSTFTSDPGCGAALSPTVTATSMSVGFGSLAQGDTCTFSFDVKVADAVTIPSTLAAGGEMTWTSISGSPGFSLLERTGIDGDSLNDYFANLTSTVDTVAGSIVKTRVSTSHTETSDPLIAMGEEAFYDITVTLPDGQNDNVVVVDDPPPGLRITDVQFLTGSFAGSITPPAGPTSGNSGDALTWNFGNVTADASPGQTDNSFVIRVTAQATFEAGMEGPPTPQFPASLTVNGTDFGTSAVDVNFALPEAKVSLTVDDSTPEENQSVLLTTRLDNSLGSGPVCDTAVVAAIPAELVIDDLDSDGLDNDLDGSTDEGDEATLLTSPTSARFPRNGCLAAGLTLGFPLRATTVAAIAPDPITATATLETYHTLPSGAGGEALDPASDTVDNNGSGAADESGDDTSALTITPAAPRLTVEKTGTDENGASLEPGETITFNIAVRNSGTGSAKSAVVTDTISTVNAAFINGSEVISPSHLSVSVSAGVLTANLDDLDPGSTVIIGFRMLVDSPLPAGATISNQAQLATSDSYGGLVSDDPATGTADDPTVLTVASTNDVDGDGIANSDDVNPTDANACSDVDSDGDGLSDSEELLAGSDLGDADSDDDGVLDGNEPNWNQDTDRDGLPNVLDADSDNDGLHDGTEMGITQPGSDTDTDRGFFVPDADPTSQTSPLNRDSDGGSVPDGAEDPDGNGAIGLDELDPTNPQDDSNRPADSDGDGLSDAQELVAGTDTGGYR
ncbi:MAG: hypothetical protein MJE77_20400 [Proteobacteria bacterium]|nr:hypothetical protein [Pseudomonadota bacterium]